jgi:hypothetical protein
MTVNSSLLTLREEAEGQEWRGEERWKKAKAHPDFCSIFSALFT